MTYIPRSSKTPINNHTNLWLRREFELSSIPAGKVVFRINRNHDAQIFLNGTEVVPAADWSDTEILLPVAESGNTTLKNGRNVLAVHCMDADGGAPIDVRIYVTQDPGAGRQKLIQELGMMIGNEPAVGRLYAGRAGNYARLGNWREAAADLSKAIELDPSESTVWYQLAPLLLELNDLPGYNRHRHQALEHFSQTGDPVVAAHIAILSLLLPASGDDLNSALKLADDAAMAEYADGFLGMRQWAKGLAEYRRGRFTNAVAWTDKALITAGRQNLPGWDHELERNRRTVACLVKAMAYFQMHNPVAARAALDQAIEIIEKQFPAAVDMDAGRDWPGWLAARILLREAQALASQQ
jgi:tetratricopeptide (TPR) repeat protein